MAHTRIILSAATIVIGVGALPFRTAHDAIHTASPQIPVPAGHVSSSAEETPLEQQVNQVIEVHMDAWASQVTDNWETASSQALVKALNASGAKIARRVARAFSQTLVRALINAVTVCHRGSTISQQLTQVEEQLVASALDHQLSPVATQIAQQVSKQAEVVTKPVVHKVWQVWQQAQAAVPQMGLAPGIPQQLQQYAKKQGWRAVKRGLNPLQQRAQRQLTSMAAAVTKQITVNLARQNISLSQWSRRVEGILGQEPAAKAKCPKDEKENERREQRNTTDHSAASDASRDMSGHDVASDMTPIQSRTEGVVKKMPVASTDDVSTYAEQLARRVSSNVHGTTWIDALRVISTAFKEVH